MFLSSFLATFFLPLFTLYLQNITKIIECPDLDLILEGFSNRDQKKLVPIIIYTIRIIIVTIGDIYPSGKF